MIKHHPESPATVLIGHNTQLIFYEWVFRVALSLIVIHRGTQSKQYTGLSQAEFVLGTGIIHQLPFFSWC
jgi:hypothetical protein